MELPYQIATLLYCFNDQDDVLLLERNQEPNRGLWSPCGGKLHTHEGESPFACACREAEEELRLRLEPGDLHLTGIVSESAYQGASHWLMFLFEVLPRVHELPESHREGRFAFIRRQDVQALPLPQTDRDQIWPLFWRHRRGFFAAHCRGQASGQYTWFLEQSSPPPP